MPVIRTDADRRADAILEENKQYWFKAYKIAILPSQDDRKAAIEAIATKTDNDYADHIQSLATTVFINRQEKREKASSKATTALRETFSKGKKPKKMKARASHAVTKSNVTKLMNKLSEGAAA